jgi:hypothetical protein
MSLRDTRAANEMPSGEAIAGFAAGRAILQTKRENGGHMRFPDHTSYIRYQAARAQARLRQQFRAAQATATTMGAGVSPAPAPAPAPAPSPAPAPAPAPGDTIISSLSTSLSAYNSANTGDWVAITLSEWDSLKTNITGTTLAGASQTMMTTTTSLGSGLANSATSAIVSNNVESPRSVGIPANSYIYGFSVRFGSNLGTSFGVFANTSTTSNTGFNQLGNLIPSLINGTNYFVQKGVSNTNGGTAGLLGFFTGTKLDYPNVSFPGSAAYVRFIGDNNAANPLIKWHLFNDTSIPTSSTVLGGSLNNYGTFCIQALTTTTKQWD